MCYNRLHQQQTKVNIMNFTILETDTINTLVRSTAKSGMSRNMSVFLVRDGQIWDITCQVADFLRYSTTKDGYIQRRGCGMDFGYDIAYSLPRKLFNDGYKLSHLNL